MSWSRTAATGAVTLPPTTQFLLRQPLDSNNNPNVSAPGEGSWKVTMVDPTNPCLFKSPVATTPPPAISNSLLLLSSTPPPVTIINIPSEVAANTGPYLPAMDIGLIAPVINELLPNPGGELSDSEDEFIELYNPNDKPFDLTGFKLQVGLSTKRSWSFADGTILPAKSFRAFRSDKPV